MQAAISSPSLSSNSQFSSFTSNSSNKVSHEDKTSPNGASHAGSEKTCFSSSMLNISSLLPSAISHKKSSKINSRTPLPLSSSKVNSANNQNDNSNNRISNSASDELCPSASASLSYCASAAQSSSFSNSHNGIIAAKSLSYAPSSFLPTLSSTLSSSSCVWPNDSKVFYNASVDCRLMLGITAFQVPQHWSPEYLRLYIYSYISILYENEEKGKGIINTSKNIKKNKNAYKAWYICASSYASNVPTPSHIKGQQIHLGCRNFLCKEKLLNMRVIPVLVNEKLGEGCIVLRPYCMFVDNTQKCIPEYTYEDIKYEKYKSELLLRKENSICLKTCIMLALQQAVLGRIKRNNSVVKIEKLWKEEKKKNNIYFLAILEYMNFLKVSISNWVPPNFLDYLKEVVVRMNNNNNVANVGKLPATVEDLTSCWNEQKVKNLMTLYTCKSKSYQQNSVKMNDKSSHVISSSKGNESNKPESAGDAVLENSSSSSGAAAALPSGCYYNVGGPPHVKKRGRKRKVVVDARLAFQGDPMSGVMVHESLNQSCNAANFDNIQSYANSSKLHSNNLADRSANRTKEERERCHDNNGDANFSCFLPSANSKLMFKHNRSTEVPFKQNKRGRPPRNALYRNVHPSAFFHASSFNTKSDNYTSSIYREHPNNSSNNCDYKSARRDAYNNNNSNNNNNNSAHVAYSSSPSYYSSPPLHSSIHSNENNNNIANIKSNKILSKEKNAKQTTKMLPLDLHEKLYENDDSIMKSCAISSSSASHNALSTARRSFNANNYEADYLKNSSSLYAAASSVPTQNYENNGGYISVRKFQDKKSGNSNHMNNNSSSSEEVMNSNNTICYNNSSNNLYVGPTYEKTLGAIRYEHARKRWMVDMYINNMRIQRCMGVKYFGFLGGLQEARKFRYEKLIEGGIKIDTEKESNHIIDVLIKIFKIKSRYKIEINELVNAMLSPIKGYEKFYNNIKLKYVLQAAKDISATKQRISEYRKNRRVMKKGVSGVRREKYNHYDEDEDGADEEEDAGEEGDELIKDMYIKARRHRELNKVEMLLNNNQTINDSQRYNMFNNSGGVLSKNPYVHQNLHKEHEDEDYYYY